MTETLKIIFLAIVQGITEFLPISSSGHLAIFSEIFGLKEGAALVAVVLHAGTLLAIIVVYFKEILCLLDKEKRRLIPLIIIGTIPVGVTGIVLKSIDLFDKIFANTICSGIGLLITGSILYFFIKTNSPGKKLEEISLKQTVFVGLAQALSILPGISRSGSTIATGIKFGIKREDAATFSFLLGIPAIGGAAFVEILSALKNKDLNAESFNYITLGIGFAVSAVVGYLALKVLLLTLEKNKLNIFAYYCFILGSIVVIWQVIRYLI